MQTQFTLEASPYNTNIKWTDIILEKASGTRAATKTPPQTPRNTKHTGYWNNFDNLRQELLTFAAIVTEPGYMPTSTSMIQHDRTDLLNAIALHGGVHTVARLLGLNTHNKQRGYWDNFENLKLEINNHTPQNEIPRTIPTDHDHHNP